MQSSFALFEQGRLSFVLQLRDDSGLQPMI
jgi:hypothetical protein